MDKKKNKYEWCKKFVILKNKWEIESHPKLKTTEIILPILQACVLCGIDLIDESNSFTTFHSKFMFTHLFWFCFSIRHSPLFFLV